MLYSVKLLSFTVRCPSICINIHFTDLLGMSRVSIRTFGFAVFLLHAPASANYKRKKKKGKKKL